MKYYSPGSFFGILFSLSGSAIKECVLPALAFAATSAGIALLHSYGHITGDYDAITDAAATCMGFMLSFRLSFAWARYDEAVTIIGDISGLSVQLMSRMCAFTTPDDDDTVQRIRDTWRRLSMVFLLVHYRLHPDEAGGALQAATSSGMMSPEEKALFRGKAHIGTDATGVFVADRAASPTSKGDGENADDGEGKGRFPSRARHLLLLQQITRDLVALHENKKLRPSRADNQTWTSLDSHVGRLADRLRDLEIMLHRNFPFVYAHMVKTTVTMFLLTVPFGFVAHQQEWTPISAFFIALVILTIDRVGAIMEMPFTYDEYHSVDMAKQIRRTDKQLASLFGLWSGRPVRHYNLFPSQAKKAMLTSGRMAFHDSTHREDQLDLPLPTPLNSPRQSTLESPLPSPNATLRGAEHVEATRLPRFPMAPSLL